MKVLSRQQDLKIPKLLRPAVLPCRLNKHPFLEAKQTYQPAEVVLCQRMLTTPFPARLFASFYIYILLSCFCVKNFICLFHAVCLVPILSSQIFSKIRMISFASIHFYIIRILWNFMPFCMSIMFYRSSICFSIAMPSCCSSSDISSVKRFRGRPINQKRQALQWHIATTTLNTLNKEMHWMM